LKNNICVPATHALTHVIVYIPRRAWRYQRGNP